MLRKAAISSATLSMRVLLEDLCLCVTFAEHWNPESHDVPNSKSDFDCVQALQRAFWRHLDLQQRSVNHRYGYTVTSETYYGRFLSAWPSRRQTGGRAEYVDSIQAHFLHSANSFQAHLLHYRHLSQTCADVCENTTFTCVCVCACV